MISLRLVYRQLIFNKFLGPPYCRAEIYAGRVACCPLVCHGEYAEGRDRQTYGRTPDRYVTICFPLEAASFKT